MTTNTTTCVYCRRSLPADAFRKSEHVIPRSFGSFEGNLTLRGSVCDECNQYFGDNLEVELARDSFEGISRVRFKVKRPEQFPGTKKAGRTTVRVAEGTYKGALAYLEYSEEKDEVIVLPVPQIGFLPSDGGEMQFESVDDLLGDLPALKERVARTNRFLFLGCDAREVAAGLSKNGVVIRLDQAVSPPEMTDDDLLCEVASSVDATIHRAVAKIAFNYLVHGNGGEYALQPSFDRIRSFIRNGKEPDYSLVEVVNRPVLADEPEEGSRRLGHLITVGIAGDGRSIVGQVSLFNWATYAVSLARDYDGLAGLAKRGHFFDIKNRRLIPLETRGSRKDVV